MKRITTAALAALTLAAPFAASPAFADPYDHHDNRGDWNRDHNNGRDNRWDNNQRGDQRFDNRGRGGYDYNRSWRRGERLDGFYSERYREVDWRYSRLRQPPRGYHYVRDDRGETLLVGLATGVILGVILNH